MSLTSTQRQRIYTEQIRLLARECCHAKGYAFQQFAVEYQPAGPIYRAVGIDDLGKPHLIDLGPEDQIYLQGMDAWSVKGGERPERAEGHGPAAQVPLLPAAESPAKAPRL